MITFRKALLKDKGILFHWLQEPHVQEFWDNSQAHKDDILNFMDGRKRPSDYFSGKFVYWVGFINKLPFSLIMTIKESLDECREEAVKKHIALTGATYSLDFMIGAKEYVGKGLGAKTLEAFTVFFKQEVDRSVDTFFIDPDLKNPRARHVYEKAGFKHVCDFMMDNQGVFQGQQTHLMVKKMV